MKKFKQSTWAIFAIAMLTMLSFTQCSDDDKGEDEEEKPAAPTLSTIDPTMGGVGETITLTGTNFSTSASTVTFTTDDAETEATVSSATATEIKCIVPDLEDGEVDVTVTANEQTTAAKTFKVVSTPVVIDFTGDEGSVGDEVTITGENFGTEPTVTINGKEQTIVSATDTEIKIELVAKTFSGDLVVTNADEMSSVAEAYTYEITYELETTAIVSERVDWITYDPDGGFYAVVDNDKVQKFSADGTAGTVYFEHAVDGDYPRNTWLGDNGILYLSTAFRLFKMDTNTETSFTEYIDENSEYAGGNGVKQIVGDNNGTVYYSNGNNNRIIAIDEATDDISVFYENQDVDNFYSLLLINNKFYTSSQEEIFSVDMETASYTEYAHVDTNGGTYMVNGSLCMFSEDEMYVYSEDTGIQGVYKLNMEDGSLNRILEYTSNTLALVPTSDGDIMICSYDGLFKLTRN